MSLNINGTCIWLVGLMQHLTYFEDTHEHIKTKSTITPLQVKQLMQLLHV